MKYSGLYFIPTPSAQPTDSSTTASALISSLETHFRTLTRSTPWTLTFRLFRDTPPRSDPTTATITTTDSPTVPHAHTYQHFLTHSALGNRCYIHVAAPPGNTAKTPASVAAIPLNQADAQAALLRNQLAALWSPRQTLGVQNGATYQGGLFVVQIGEVRALREAQGAGVSSPGVVVCISTVMGGDGEDANDDNEDNDGKAKNGAENGAGDEVDVGYAQAMIRDLWGNIRQGRDLGRAEVREVFMALNNGRPDVDAAVRMWCEVLRLRG